MLVEGEVIERAEHKIPKGGEGGKGKLRIYCVEKGGKVLDGWIRWQTRMFFFPLPSNKLAFVAQSNRNRNRNRSLRNPLTL